MRTIHVKIPKKCPPFKVKGGGGIKRDVGVEERKAFGRGKRNKGTRWKRK